MSDVALVTGASRGIGRAVAFALASDGHRVAINYSSDADAAKETLARIEEGGGEGIVVQADVSDSSQVNAAFDEVEDRLGPVVSLVNNAGIRKDGLALKMSDDSWNSVVAVNLFGTFACCRRALRTMVRKRGGCIVNVTSVAGLRGSPGQVNYAAAKAGVIALTRTLAREVASKNIRVNAVAPGLIETDLTSGMTESQTKALLGETPLRRAGSPEEVARLVAYLCSKDAGYVTGAIYTLDGGLTS